MAEATVGRTFRDVVHEAVRSGDVDLNLRERVKLRIVLRECPEKLEQQMLIHAMAEGVVPAGTSLESSFAVNWEALAEFIKEILPVILTLIKLFV